MMTFSLAQHSASPATALVLTSVTPLCEPLPQNTVFVDETEPADVPFVLCTSASYVLAPSRPALPRPIGGNSCPGGEGAGGT